MVLAKLASLNLGVVILADEWMIWMVVTRFWSSGVVILIHEQVSLLVVISRLDSQNLQTMSLKIFALMILKMLLQVTWTILVLLVLVSLLQTFVKANPVLEEIVWAMSPSLWASLDSSGVFWTCSACQRSFLFQIFWTCSARQLSDLPLSVFLLLLFSVFGP